MPVETIITCDVCGEDRATSYSSMFQVLNENEGCLVIDPDTGLGVRAPFKGVYNISGCAHHPGLRINLCSRHFKHLNEICSRWLSAATLSHQISLTDERDRAAGEIPHKPPFLRSSDPRVVESWILKHGGIISIPVVHAGCVRYGLASGYVLTQWEESPEPGPRRTWDLDEHLTDDVENWRTR